MDILIKCSYHDQNKILYNKNHNKILNNKNHKQIFKNKNHKKMLDNKSRKKLERMLISTNAPLFMHAKTQRHCYVPYLKKIPIVCRAYQDESIDNNTLHLVRIEKQLLSSSSLIIQTLARFRNKTSSVDAVAMKNIKKKYTLKNIYTLKRYKVFFQIIIFV